MLVEVRNIYGFVLYGTFGVSVVDTRSPVWVNMPADQMLNSGEQLRYDLIVWDLSIIDLWTLNDTTHFSLAITDFPGGSVGTIANIIPLSPGIYGLNVSVFDKFSNRQSAIFTVFVFEDTLSPTLIEFSGYTTLQYGQDLRFHLEAWDESGIDHWWLNDTIHFAIDEDGVIRNATILEPGIYGLEVRAYDPYDNYCSATLILTVLEPHTTTTVTTTTTATTTSTTTSTTTTTTREGMDPLLSFGMGAGIGGAVILVIAILLFRKRA